MPGYLEQQDALKEAGIDEVLVYCVNDGAVMKAWAEDQGVEDSMITFMGDPAGAFTGGLSPSKVLDHPGPVSVLGGPRCKRFGAYLLLFHIPCLQMNSFVGICVSMKGGGVVKSS